VRRWVKVTLAILAGFIILLVLNAIAVSNQTEDAERNVEGAELIDTSNGTIQVLDEGNPSGSPIVLIHGYTTSMRWFDHLAPLLTADHRVIRVDLLGHGGSDKPSTGYEIEDQANAIAEALSEMGVQGATVVGHSLGASVATALAEQSPDLATKIVDVDQAPDDSFDDDLGFTADLAYVPVIGQAVQRVTDVAPTTLVRDQFQVAFAPDYNIASGFENPDQVVEDLREMTYTAFVEIAEKEDDYSGARPLNERLTQVPLLVIFGTEDQLSDAEEATAAFEGIPGVQIELIEGAGHSPHVETPDEVAALILEFAAAPVPGEEPATPKKKSKDKNSKKDSAKKDGDGKKDADEPAKAKK